MHPSPLSTSLTLERMLYRFYQLPLLLQNFFFTPFISRSLYPVIMTRTGTSLPPRDHAIFKDYNFDKWDQIWVTEHVLNFSVFKSQPQQCTSGWPIGIRFAFGGSRKSVGDFRQGDFHHLLLKSRGIKINLVVLNPEILDPITWLSLP